MPKLLYPVAGKPILEWILGELEPLCRRLVFVVSPAGASPITLELERLLPGRFEIVVQHEPLGMGHAVLVAREKARTPSSLVVWGDQVGARRETIKLCLAAHTMRVNAAATLPTALHDHPYIHLERDGTGRLTRILQLREGDTLPDRGESDCGVFLFKTGSLFDTLAQMQSWPDAWGRHSKELNLLPIFPLLDQEPGSVCCVRIAEIEQSVGINTAEDIEAVKASLLARNR